METKVKTAATATTDKKDNSTANNLRPSLSGKETKNDNTKDQSPAQTPQAAPEAAAQVKAGNPSAEAQQAAQPAEAVSATSQAEPTKKDIKAVLQEQNARGLEDTVKLVEELGKKISQKNKLSNTISNLDSFIVTQNDDKDDVAGDSKFPRCELVISDDGGEEFVTKNPFIIAKVVDMVKQLCIEKLAEVEATIVIP